MGTNVGFTFNRLRTTSGVSSTMFATPEDFVSPTGLDNLIVSFQSKLLKSNLLPINYIKLFSQAFSIVLESSDIIFRISSL